MKGNMSITAEPMMNYITTQDDNVLTTAYGNTTTTINLSSAILEGIDYENLFNEMLRRINRVPLMHHNCNNCGGTLEMNANKHIFNCPYCGTVYAIGTFNPME